MFCLPNATACKILNLNPRDEKHGDEDVLAVDVKFSMTLPNSRLAMFDPGLLLALYLPADADSQTTIDGVERISTALRCAIMEPIALDTVIEGRDVWIERATTTLTLPTCKLGKFVVRAMEGGSCEITFRAQCSNVEAELIGHLCSMLKRDVSVIIQESQAAEDPLPHDSTAASSPGSSDALDATQEFLQRIKNSPEGKT